MKIINSEFNEIKNFSDSKYNIIYSQVIEFLKSIIKDEKIMLNIIKENDDIIFQETIGKEYSIKAHDGSIRKYKFPDSASAFKTNMAVNIDDNELTLTPGICLRPASSKHHIIHELLHAMSSNRHNYFNDEGIVYTKTGTKVDYYDRNLDDYSNGEKISSDGLNEGMTELLTSIITNEYTGTYAHLAVICNLLMRSNNNLIDAYFSKNLEELEKFYRDLEEKQSIITRNDLCQLSSNTTDEELIAKIITGSIQYNKECNNEIDLSTLDNIINYLDRSYILDSGSWKDLINIENLNKKI